MKKQSTSDLAKIILAEGTIIQHSMKRVMVKAFNQTYIIDDPYGRKPKIRQMEKITAISN